MSIPNFVNAHKYVMQRLEDDLPPSLFYHAIHHTRDQVLRDTEALAETQGVSAEEMLLLRTGALYHDMGFIEQYWDNEPVGVRIAEETLPTFGYTAGQIEVVKGLILATRVPQSPRSFSLRIPYRNGGNDNVNFWKFIRISLKPHRFQERKGNNVTSKPYDNFFACFIRRMENHLSRRPICDTPYVSSHLGM